MVESLSWSDFPAAQLTHAVAPALAYAPTSQGEHCLALVALLARPAGHCWHAVAPMPANVPAPHAEQRVAPAFANEPASHLGHAFTVALVREERPASHAAHTELLEKEERPGGQSTHTLGMSSVRYLPATHGMHRYR